MNRHLTVRFARLLRRAGLGLAGGALTLGALVPAAASAETIRVAQLQGQPNAVESATGYIAANGTVVVFDDASVAKAATVAVLPARLAGDASDAAWFDLAAGLQQGALDPSAVAAAAAPMELSRQGALGFAGQATDADLEVLRISVGLGHVLALRGMGDHQGAAALAAELRREAAVLDILDAPSKAAAKAILDGGADQLVGVALGEALSAGLRGIPTRERAHGYFVAGVWSAAATLVAARGGNEHFRQFAEPMAQMLDRDARFGSEDRVIATAMRRIASELGQSRPDAGKVRMQLDHIVRLARG